MPGALTESRRWQLGAAVALGVGAAGSGVALLVISAWLISRAAERPPVLYLMLAIVGVRAFALAKATLRYAERLVAHDAAFRVLGELRERVYLQLERLVPVGLADMSSAGVVSRLVSDVDAAVDRLVRVRLPLVVAAITTAGATIAVWQLYSAVGAALAVVVTGLFVGVAWVVRRAGRHLEREMAPARARLAAASDRLFTAAPDLVAYGQVDDAVSRVVRADAELRRIERRSAWTQGLGAAVLVAGLGAGVWISLGIGIPAVHSGRLDPVLLAVVALTPLALIDVLGALPGAAALSDRSASSLGRVRELLDAPDPVPEPAYHHPLRAGGIGIRLADVRAQWSAESPWVLAGVDLDLPAGRRIAITGPSGSGKSTLAAVLLRLLDIGGGRMLLGGEDVRDLRGDDVRRVVGLCAQDAYLFDTTIRDNLRLARPDASDADLLSVLDAARLRRWVERLPAGLDTRVGEHGAQVSGGERQRLALARVLLADPPVVVLDEPTEHLDDAAAAEITADLLDATKGRTVVLLTHRPIAPGSVDATYVLSSGRLRPLLAAHDHIAASKRLSLAD